MSVHNSLKNFKQWVNTDLNSPKRKEVTNKIDQDLKLDSPSILKSIDGKYILIFDNIYHVHINILNIGSNTSPSLHNSKEKIMIQWDKAPTNHHSNILIYKTT